MVQEMHACLVVQAEGIGVEHEPMRPAVASYVTQWWNIIHPLLRLLDNHNDFMVGTSLCQPSSPIPLDTPTDQDLITENVAQQNEQIRQAQNQLQTEAETQAQDMEDEAQEVKAQVDEFRIQEEARESRNRDVQPACKTTSPANCCQCHEFIIIIDGADQS